MFNILNQDNQNYLQTCPQPQSLQSKYYTHTIYAIPIYLLGALLVPSFTIKQFLFLSLWIFSHLFLSESKFFKDYNNQWIHLALASFTSLFLYKTDKHLALLTPFLIYIIPIVTFYLTRSKLEALVAYAIYFALNKLCFEHSLNVSPHVDLCCWITFISLLNLFICFFFTSYSANNTQPRQNHEKYILELKKLLELRENSLITVSHECRNPLNGIQSNLDLAEATLGNQATLEEAELDKVKSFLHNAKICGEVLLQYINNILDTAKVESNGIDIHPTPTDIRKTLEKVWAVCSESIRKKNLVGTLILDEKVPRYLNIDSYRIIQVMINLINNSIKFTKKGGITIRVGWSEEDDCADGLSPESKTPKNLKVINKTLSVVLPRAEMPFKDFVKFHMNEPFSLYTQRSKTLNADSLIQIQESNYTLNFENKQFFIPDRSYHFGSNFEDREGVLTIAIIDTGCGISKENVPKLFQKFSQVNKDPSKRKVGTGLGLWLCKHICEGMKGSIEVQSREDYGSSFIVSIPTITCENSFLAISEPVAISSSGLCGIVPDKKSKLKVIVSGVDNYSRNIHKIFIQKCGHEVVAEATNEIATYNAYKRHAGEVNVIVLELDIPQAGNMGLCKLIRDYEERCNLVPCVIIVMGSDSTRNNKRKSLESNRAYYDYFVQTPCSFHDMKQTLEKSEVAGASNALKKINSTKQKVLVIDDDGFCLEIAKNFLTNAHIDTLLASCSDEGLDLFKKRFENVGCILIDYEMPDRNGRDTMLLIKHIFAQKMRNPVPIYCCTGNSSCEFKTQMKQEGFTEVYEKPLNWKKITTDIKRVLNDDTN